MYVGIIVANSKTSCIKEIEMFTVCYASSQCYCLRYKMFNNRGILREINYTLTLRYSFISTDIEGNNKKLIVTTQIHFIKDYYGNIFSKCYKGVEQISVG